MGYYANWYGILKTKEKPSDTIIECLKNTFEGAYYDAKAEEIELQGYEKYHEDCVYDALAEIKPIMEEGNIEFTGEDDAHWKIYFKEGNWIEESGKIYYESDLPAAQQDKEEFIGQIIDVIQDYTETAKSEIIMGEDYDNLKDKLTDIMKAWKVF